MSRSVAAALATPPEAPAFRTIRLPADLEDHIFGADLQLALWMLYEQSYRGFDDAEDHEWDPAAVDVRRRLEIAFERALRRETGPVLGAVEGDDLATRFQWLVAALEGASNRLISVEDLTGDELHVLHRHYQLLAQRAKEFAAPTTGRRPGRKHDERDRSPRRRRGRGRRPTVGPARRGSG